VTAKSQVSGPEPSSGTVQARRSSPAALSPSPPPPRLGPATPAHRSPSWSPQWSA